MVEELNKKYMAAFEDPVVKQIEGKDESLIAISNIFEENDSVTFFAKKSSSMEVVL